MNRNVARQIAPERGVDIRMPSTALLGISSADRYKSIQERRAYPTYPFSFIISKADNLINGFFTRIALTEFRMNWALPNIAACWGNNRIQATIQGQPPQVITLPDGFYTPQDIGDILEDLLDAAFPLYNWTIQTDKTSGILFITCVLTATSALQTISFQPDPANTSPFRQLYDLLNLTFTPYAPVPAPPIIPTNGGTIPALSIFTGVPVLRFTDFIDVVCENLTAVQSVKDTSSSRSPRDVLCRVYLDVDMPSDATYENAVLNTTFNNPAPPAPPTQTATTRAEQGYGARMNAVRPFVLYRQFETPKQIKWLPNTPVGQVQFDLYDDQGRSINDLLLSANAGVVAPRYAVACDWNATLLLTEV